MFCVTVTKPSIGKPKLSQDAIHVRQHYCQTILMFLNDRACGLGSVPSETAEVRCKRAIAEGIGIAHSLPSVQAWRARAGGHHAPLSGACAAALAISAAVF